MAFSPPQRLVAFSFCCRPGCPGFSWIDSATWLTTALPAFIPPATDLFMSGVVELGFGPPVTAVLAAINALLADAFALEAAAYPSTQP